MESLSFLTKLIADYQGILLVMDQVVMVKYDGFQVLENGGF